MEIRYTTHSFFFVFWKWLEKLLLEAVFCVNIFTEKSYSTGLKVSNFNCRTSQRLYNANDTEWILKWPCGQLGKEQVGAGEGAAYLKCVRQGTSYFKELCELVIKEHTLENPSLKKKILIKLR